MQGLVVSSMHEWDIHHAIRLSLESIIQFAKITNAHHPYGEIFDNPTLTFVFPQQEEVILFLNDKVKDRSPTDIESQLVQYASWLFKAYVKTAVKPNTREHDLTVFGHNPSWLDGEYEDITNKIRFFLATQGAIHYYYNSEYESTRRKIQQMVRLIHPPISFWERMTIRKWPTSSSLWAAWIRFKLNNKEHIAGLSKVIIQSVVKLESLRLVLEYLDRPSLEPHVRATLDERAHAIAVRQRRSVVESCSKVFTFLSQPENLESVRNMIACFSTLTMVSFFEPAVPDYIQRYVDQIMSLIQQLEMDIIVPSMEIEAEQREMEQDVVAMAYVLPKFKSTPSSGEPSLLARTKRHSLAPTLSFS